MISLVLWTIFELSISLFENFLLIDPLTRYLKPKYEGKTGRIVFFSMLGLMFAYSFTVNIPKFASIEFFVTISILFLYALLFLQGNIIQKLVAAIISRGLLSITNSFVLFVCSYLFRQDIATFMKEQDYMRIIVVLLSKILLLFASKFILGFMQRNGSLISWQWAVAGISLFFSTLAGTTAIGLGRKMAVHSMEQMQLFLITVGVWAMCLSTYFLMGKLAKDNQMKMEYALLKQQQEYQKKSLETVKSSNEEVQQIKHDMKNQITTIGTLIKRQDYAAAQEKCEAIVGKIQEIQTLVHTGNESIDATLNNKLMESKRKHINTKCSIFTDLKNMDAFTFCTVIGNLLDNAIEAQERLPKDQRLIQVTISKKLGFTDFVVENAIAESVLATNAQLKTSKANTALHGIGHKSVERAMRECGGSILYWEADGNFVARARFPF